MAGASPRERRALAAYLGHGPARVALGDRAPAAFALSSMTRGGDRRWRTLMRELGHESAAAAACSVAELALTAYLAEPDSGPEVEALARAAGAALGRWRSGPRADQARAGVREDCLGFALAVDVGGRLWGAGGFRGRQLGRVLGRCASVVLAPENPRHVRWLGEAAEDACRALGLSEDAVCRAVAGALLPYIIPAEPTAAPDGGGS